MSAVSTLGLEKLKKAKKYALNRSRKLAWRLTKRWRGNTVPVFIFGAQRSGTTMLGECLGNSPEILNMGEFDKKAFDQHSIRDLQIVKQLIDKSAYKYLVLKPLMDSNRALELLDLRPESKGIWLYRHYADRVNSAVKHSGRHPLDVFNNYKKSGDVSWQLRGLDELDSEIIRKLDIDALTVNDGAALMWYIRNKLFFNLKLERLHNMYILSYEDLVSDVAAEVSSLTKFIGCDYSSKMVEGVHKQSVRKNSPPKIDSFIEGLCLDLYDRLETTKRSMSRFTN